MRQAEALVVYLQQLVGAPTSNGGQQLLEIVPSADEGKKGEQGDENIITASSASTSTSLAAGINFGALGYGAVVGRGGAGRREGAEEVEVGVLPSGASPSHTRRPENPKI